MATFICTASQRRMAERIIDLGPLEGCRSLEGLAGAGGVKWATARRYVAKLRRLGVVRVWSWSVDEHLYRPELPGDGAPFWLPSDSWDSFLDEARALGLKVRELGRIE